MNRFLTKYSTVAGKIPVAADLVQRELAVNTADSLLYMLNSAGAVVNLNPLPFLIYNGSTSYRSNTTVRYANSQTTDANGRVTFNITKDGTSTGNVIFTKIFGVQATAMGTGTTNVGQYYFASVESVAAKQIIVRLLAPVSAVVTLGSTAQFAGSGVTCYLEVSGTP